MNITLPYDFDIDLIRLASDVSLRMDERIEDRGRISFRTVTPWNEGDPRTLEEVARSIERNGCIIGISRMTLAEALEMCPSKVEQANALAEFTEG